MNRKSTAVDLLRPCPTIWLTILRALTSLDPLRHAALLSYYVTSPDYFLREENESSVHIVCIFL